MESFTHISPLFYSLNYDYASGVASYSNCATAAGTLDCTDRGTDDFDGLTTQAFAAQLASAGLAVVPGIYAGADNDGTDVGVQNILDDLAGVGASFIAAMVGEAVSNGYGGYNLDWEMGSGVGAAYTDKFVAFADAFKQALAPRGMSLSVDAIASNIDGTWCSDNDGFLDFSKLASSSVDRVIIEDYTGSLGTPFTSCQPVVLSHANPVACPLNAAGTDVTVTGLLNFMCSNLPASMVVIGFIDDPSGTNPIAGQVMSTVESYGFTKVAIFPQDTSGTTFLASHGLVADQSSWYGVLQTFLSL